MADWVELTPGYFINLERATAVRFLRGSIGDNVINTDGNFIADGRGGMVRFDASGVAAQIIREPASPNSTPFILFGQDALILEQRFDEFKR